MQVNSYLTFGGRCEEALEFYKAALGAEVDALMRFKDAPACGTAPGMEEKVMHASFRVGDTTILASDGQCSGATDAFEGFSLALTAPTPEEAERLFAAISEGGQVQMPMAETFFAPRFGVVADRFGVSWMVLAAA